MRDLSTIRDELRTYERQVGGSFILQDEGSFVRLSHWVGGQFVWIMATPDLDMLMRWVRLYVADSSSVKHAAE